MPYKKASNYVSLTTPTVEKSEGVRPAQHYKPAPYLPLVRFDKKVGEYKVISLGKVVAVDSRGDIVPAGLWHDINTAIADGNFDNVVNKYTATDVAEGVKNFAGDPVTLDEPVVKSFFVDGDATKALINYVGLPVGIAPYDVWRSNGAGRDNNPVDFTFNNFNLQQGMSVLTRYFIELPVVSDYTAVAYPGIAAFEGTPKNGELVTFNANSNFVTLGKLAESTFAAASEGNPTNAELQSEFNKVINYINNTQGVVLGRIYFVDTEWPKDMLDYVKTWDPNITDKQVTDVAPGTATKGLPDLLTYAGVSDPAQAKTVKINLLV
jgi:hypothetical protein